jgi:hypothetical protein
MKIFLFLIVLLQAGPTLVRADDEVETAPKTTANGKTKIIYRKKTAVSFDDAVVEGNSNNPEGVYVVTPPPTAFGSLLKLRPNFHRELMRDALLLK